MRKKIKIKNGGLIKFGNTSFSDYKAQMKAQEPVLCLLAVCCGTEFHGVTRWGLFIQLWGQLLHLGRTLPYGSLNLHTNKICTYFFLDKCDQKLSKYTGNYIQNYRSKYLSYIWAVRYHEVPALQHFSCKFKCIFQCMFICLGFLFLYLLLFIRFKLKMVFFLCLVFLTVSQISCCGTDINCRCWVIWH